MTSYIPANITVPFAEESDFPVEGRARDGNVQCRTRYRCAWANRWQLINELLGLVNVGDTSQVVLPHEYPHEPGIYATNVNNVRGEGSPSAASASKMQYATAVMDVTYGTNGGSSNPLDILVEETLDPSGQLITAGTKELYWANDDTAPLELEEAPRVAVGMLEWGYRIKRLIITNTSVQSALLGGVPTCNAAAVTSPTLGVTFAAETIKYAPPRLQRALIPNASAIGGVGFQFGSNPGLLNTIWDAQFRLTYNPYTWNKFWRAGDDAPVPIYKAGGSQFKPVPPGSAIATIVGLL